jgi:serine/threonine protein kinase/formylglycine-generating enzyme required for sulfatase activity
MGGSPAVATKTPIPGASPSAGPAAPPDAGSGGSVPQSDPPSLTGLRTIELPPGRPPLDSQGGVIGERYDILQIIGEGGMGVVYLANDRRLSRKVAIKRLRAPAEAARRGIERFLQEARAIAALNHRSIVTIHELAEDDRGPFIVMEYLAGGDLQHYVEQRGKLDLKTAMVVMRAVGQALSYAHRRSIFHRDIKPSNILLTEDGSPKLVDFGLAQITRESELSATGFGLGTMAYMAPEQKRDAKHADHRSDIYAMARTLYHLLTGEAPDAMDLEALPAQVRPAVRRALRSRPEDRQFSVGEFLHELEQGDQAAAASAAARKGAVKPGTCIGCGLANPPDVKFCRGCGAGLFDTCPACGRSDHVGIAHCGSCGVNIARYRESRDSLARAQSMLLQHEYGRARKEAEQGLAAGYLKPELTRVRTDATARQQEFDQLAGRIQQMVAAEDFEGADPLIRQALVLVPQRQELSALAAELPARLRQRNLRRRLSAAQSLRSARRFAEAEETLLQGLKLDPGLEELRALLAEVRADRTAAELEDLCRAARETAAAGSYADAMARLQAADALGLTLAQRTRVEELRKRLSDAQLSRLVSEAEALLAAAKFEAGRARLHEALAINPSCAPATQLLQRIPELVRQRNIAALVTQVKSALKDNRFPQALQLCSEKAVAVGEASQVRELQDAARAIQADHRQRLTRARELASQADLGGAAAEYGQLASSYPWDSHVLEEKAAVEARAGRVGALIQQALTAEKRSRLGRAMRLWQEVLAECPGHAKATAAMAGLPDRIRHRRRRASRWAVAAGAVLLLLAAGAYYLWSNQKLLDQARQLLGERRHEEAAVLVLRTSSLFTWGRSAVEERTRDAWRDATDQMLAEHRWDEAEASARRAQQSFPADIRFVPQARRAAYGRLCEQAETAYRDGRVLEAANAYLAARPLAEDPEQLERRLTAITAGLTARADEESRAGRFRAAIPYVQAIVAVGGVPESQARLSLFGELAGLLSSLATHRQAVVDAVAASRDELARKLADATLTKADALAADGREKCGEGLFANARDAWRAAVDELASAKVRKPLAELAQDSSSASGSAARAKAAAIAVGADRSAAASETWSAALAKSAQAQTAEENKSYVTATSLWAAAADDFARAEDVVRNEQVRDTLKSAESAFARTLYRQARDTLVRALNIAPNSAAVADLLRRVSEKLGIDLDLGRGVSLRAVYIEPGQFPMGSPPNQTYHQGSDEQQHPVTVSGGCYMGATEVTQSQWAAVMGGDAGGLRGDLPVHGITHRQAMEFCRKLSAKTSRMVRLPTEAEWEYACRAGTTDAWNTGREIATTQASFTVLLIGRTSRPATVPALRPVASFTPNAWGLHDMHGNVAEWCSDWYAVDYPKQPVHDPAGPPMGDKRVVRGGSWRSEAPQLRSAARWAAAPTEVDTTVGFRVVIGPAAQP